MVTQDARQWSEWGFDYIKMDWYLIDVPNTERIAADLKKSGRDIVLSVSNSTPFEIAAPISRLTNVWRTTGDIEDHWGSLNVVLAFPTWPRRPIWSMSGSFQCPGLV